MSPTASLRINSAKGDNLTPRTKKRNIVIVDDEPNVRKMFKRLFNPKDYAVETYATCENLLTKICHSIPDLLIIDLVLPLESGENFVKKIS